MNTVVNGEIIEYSIIRSGRRTVGITIDRDGSVKISAPYNVSKKDIDEIVKRKAAWIIRKKEELKKIHHKSKNKELKDGDKILYIGREYILKIKKESGVKRPQIVLDESTATVILPENRADQKESVDLKHILKSWYKEQFKKVAGERIDIYSSKTGTIPVRVTIREQKTRWGSCSRKGNINLNWKLITAPLYVLDYVIVHELSHLKKMNHSKRFWSLVESIIPDYKAYRKWLKENGHSLGI